MIEVKLSTAVHVRAFMKGRDTGLGYPGYAANLTVSLSKSTDTLFNDITSGVTITDLGLGWYDILLSTTHTNTLGIANLHVSGSAVFDNDEVSLNVIAVDKQDTTRMGMTALPNAAAGANNGLPVVGTQIPNATAGANNGLPTVGAQIPNATAGANTGLPVVGTQVPNATAGASGGLPLLDADLNVHSDLQRWKGTVPSNLDGANNVPANVATWDGGAPATVLDTVLAGHTTAGTVGGALSNILSASQVASAVLDALRSGHVVPGSIGEGIAIAASLLQGNFYMDNTDNSDPNGQTAARLRCFHTGTATQAATFGGSGEGEFATFLVVTTYSGPNKITDHRVVQQ